MNVLPQSRDHVPPLAQVEKGGARSRECGSELKLTCMRSRGIELHLFALLTRVEQNANTRIRVETKRHLPVRAPTSLRIR